MLSHTRTLAHSDGGRRVCFHGVSGCEGPEGCIHGYAPTFTPEKQTTLCMTCASELFGDEDDILAAATSRNVYLMPEIDDEISDDGLEDGAPSQSIGGARSEQPKQRRRSKMSPEAAALRAAVVHLASFLYGHTEAKVPNCMNACM